MGDHGDDHTDHKVSHSIIKRHYRKDTSFPVQSGSQLPKKWQYVKELNCSDGCCYRWVSIVAHGTFVSVNSAF